MVVLMEYAMSRAIANPMADFMEDWIVEGTGGTEKISCSSKSD